MAVHPLASNHTAPIPIRRRMTLMKLANGAVEQLCEITAICIEGLSVHGQIDRIDSERDAHIRTARRISQSGRVVCIANGCDGARYQAMTLHRLDLAEHADRLIDGPFGALARGLTTIRAIATGISSALDRALATQRGRGKR